MPRDEQHWAEAARNETQHVDDPTWANETRLYLRRQQRRTNLIAFATGLATMQLVAIAFQVRLPWLFHLYETNQNMPLWSNLSELPIVISAFVVAWLLGRRGQRVWPVALAFVLFPVVDAWTSAIFGLMTIAGRQYTSMFDVWQAMRSAAQCGLLGAAFAALGAWQTRRRRQAR